VVGEGGNEGKGREGGRKVREEGGREGEGMEGWMRRGLEQRTVSDSTGFVEETVGNKVDWTVFWMDASASVA